MNNRQDKKNYSKKGKHYRGKPSSGKGESFSEKEKTSKTSIQDPFFYAKDDQALHNMARFPWAVIAGNTLNLDDQVEMAIPGIAVLKYIPTLGCAGFDYDDETFTARNTNSALTRAISAMFNYISVGFTGSIPVEGSDMYVAIMCAAHVMLNIIKGIRAYGLLRYYLMYNKYWGKVLIEALGFNFQNLLDNAANFRTQLNIRIEQFNKAFKIPKGIMAIERWIYLISNVFVDDPDDEKAQIYAYDPACYWEYDGYGLPTGSAASVRQVRSGLTVVEYFHGLDEQFTALDDDDVRTIFGAIARVYTDAAIYQMQLMDDNVVTKPVYHDIVLDQIHNTDIVQARYVSPDFGATPGSNYWAVVDEYALYQIDGGNSLYCTPCVTDLSKTSKGLVDVLEHGMVEPAVAIDALNNKVVSREHIDGNYPVNTSLTFYPISCRADVVTEVNVYCMTEGVVKQRNVTENLVSDMADVSALAVFNYAPLLLVEDSAWQVTLSVSELTNYCHIPASQVITLNDACMFTLLNMQPSDKIIARK